MDNCVGKAGMNMKEAGVLLYNLATDKGEQINKLCNVLGIKVRWVEPKEYNLSLDSLSNFGGPVSVLANQKTTDNFLGEMMVMVNFTDELLDKFLKEYKLNKIEPVFLKAILTPHNKTWSSIMLQKELIRERLEINRSYNRK